MIVNSTRFTTAGAALAHVDLALRIIRGRSPALAALVARYLLVEARSSQAEFVIPDHLAHADPMVERFERSEEQTSELKSLMRISYAVFCLKKKKREEIRR